MLADGSRRYAGVLGIMLLLGYAAPSRQSSARRRDLVCRLRAAPMSGGPFRVDGMAKYPDSLALAVALERWASRLSTFTDGVT